jgi:hypothetical protein
MRVPRAMASDRKEEIVVTSRSCRLKVEAQALLSEQTGS